MFPHVKVFHLINASKDEKLKLLKRHKDDVIFKQLVEIMCSPDYVFTYVDEPTFEKEITVDTKDTFKRFTLLLHKAQYTNEFEELLSYVSSLDSITRYVYLHVIRGNDLGIPFTTVASILNLYVRRTYAEIPRTFGFPTFPFFAYFLDDDVDYFDVHFRDDTVNVTYRDGRKVVDFDFAVYSELSTLNLQGVLKGYIQDGVYVVTNFYTLNNYGKFTDRLKLVELELLRNNTVFIQLVNMLEVTCTYDLEDVAVHNKDVICVPDEEQKLEGDHNVFILQGHRLTSLIEERKKADTWR